MVFWIRLFARLFCKHLLLVVRLVHCTWHMAFIKSWLIAQVCLRCTWSRLWWTITFSSSHSSDDSAFCRFDFVQLVVALVPTAPLASLHSTTLHMWLRMFAADWVAGPRTVFSPYCVKTAGVNEAMILPIEIGSIWHHVTFALFIILTNFVMKLRKFRKFCAVGRSFIRGITCSSFIARLYMNKLFKVNLFATANAIGIAFSWSRFSRCETITGCDFYIVFNYAYRFF